MRALINGGMWLVVALVLVAVISDAAESQSGARSKSTQGVLQLQHAGVALIEDSEVVLGMDVSPHFRFADRNVDSTLLDDLNNMLIQTQARAVRQHCKLFGNWFGWMIQGCLGVAAFTALLIKKFMDSKQRDWMTWFRDTSKQAIGSIVAHMWNLLFATLLQSKEEEDPCVYYLVNYLVDAVLGCILSLLLLWGFESMADKYSWDLLRSGDYGNGSSQSDVWKRWGFQLSLWVAIVTGAKLVLLFCLIVPAKQPLYVGGAWMMSGVVNYPRLELTLVMIIIPLIFNVLTFWVTDNFLMNNDEQQQQKEAPPLPTTAIGPIHPPSNSGGATGASVGAAVAPGVAAASDSAQITVTVGGGDVSVAATPRRDEASASDVPTQSLLAS